MCARVCWGHARVYTYLGEDAVFLTGCLAPLHGVPDTVVAPLHQPPLQLDGVSQVLVLLVAAALAAREALELGVEGGVLALHEEQEQVQASDLVSLGQLGGQDRGGQLVEGLELLDVAGEGRGVAGADGGEGALLVEGAREREEVRRGGGGDGQGVELEEVKLGAREEGGGLIVGEGRGLEFGDDLGEALLRHGVGSVRVLGW